MIKPQFKPGDKVKVKFNLFDRVGTVVSCFERGDDNNYVNYVVWFNKDVRLFDVDEKYLNVTMSYLVWPEYCLTLIPQDVQVKLNDKYSAVFTPGEESVKVGCQQIPVSSVLELAEAIKKTLKNP